MKELEPDKYVVIPKDRIKQDGTVEVNPFAQYFVLRLDTDPIARKALKTYITELYKDGEFILAGQLMDWLNQFLDKDTSEKPLKLKGRCPVCTSEEITHFQKKGVIGGKETVLDDLHICTNCGVMLKFLIE